MTQLKKSIMHEMVRPLFTEMRVGIEKESQRVTLDGKLAQTDHPAVFGCRSIHPFIQTDFSETQVEIITPVTQSGEEVLDYLAALHEVVLRSLPEDEMLWPLSMPPILPQKEEDIMIAKLAKKEEVLYRRYLAKTYGKRKQMVSGIHYNFEFSHSFLSQLYEHQNIFTNFQELKNEVYLTVTQNYLRHRWLITYLFGASPFSEEGYFKKEEERPNEPVRSIRNSEYGYTNSKNVKASYESVPAHAHAITDLVNKGILSEEKEFYAPVRLRGGKNVSDLLEKGVHYIEVRNIDLNPFAPYGISAREIRFLQLFLMFMLWCGRTDETTDEWIAQGHQWNNQVALENPLNPTSLLAEGEILFAQMRDMATELELDEEDYELIEAMQKVLWQPEKTLAAKMLLEMEIAQQDNHQFAVNQGLHFNQMAHAKPYQLAGFRDMELSTQLLIFEALQHGIGVELLDRQDQFLALSYGDHVEYVKNANMTSKDTYISSLIMENKVVTKKVLAKKGFRVPGGAEYNKESQAIKGYPLFANQAIVIKPKTTNYGLGISIFKEPASFDHYQEAIRLAFEEDQSVLVEEFIEGTEYRFTVIDGKVLGIMKRVPANVEGDGKQTISELVAEKNLDILRGTHYRSPLEKIKLGEIEALMLQEQGLSFESIPAQGQIVYLRENSNVSTGGDSIDHTDDVHESYKEMAVKAVKALGVEICGIDVIIPDITVPATEKNYGIIEANFNPAMHMHAYPFKGIGRNLPKAVLQLLFPEAFKS